MAKLAQALQHRRAPLAGSPLAERSAPVSVAGEFIWDQDPPENWVRALRTLSPKSDVHGWLYLHWMAGEQWVPGQRWVLYEMIHPRWVDFDLMEEYDGPNPRTEGHYCSDKVPKQFQCYCDGKLEAWRDGPCSVCHKSPTRCLCRDYLPYTITADQWRIYKKTGYVPRNLFWIIQGEGGGHKAFLTEQEEDWLTAAGMSLELPYLGELDYAPFDARVLAHIQKLNKLRRFNDDLQKFKRAMGPEYAAEVQKQAREFRESVVSWFDQQMKQECDLFVEAADNGEMDNQPTTDIDYERLVDVGVPHYIETGQFLHPSQLDGPTVATD